MIVELISVGTELLLGNIVNTNAAYLSEKCAALGLSCYYQSVVGDNELRLSLVIEQALKRSDILILSGGLGPTQDDLTKEVVAKVLGLECELHQPSKERILSFFQKRNMAITENNWKQAMLPKGCKVVTNYNGTAPGIIIESNLKEIVMDTDKVTILLPGPPNELIPMFETSIVPYLRKLNPSILFSETVKICGIGESKAETMILDLIEGQTNPTIATYAKTGEVHIRVTAQAINTEEARKLIAPMVSKLKQRFGEHIFTLDDNVTLEEAIIDILKVNHLTLATVESCTGGLLAARFINVSGVSDVFQTGHITYSNEAKSKVLGIDEAMIEEHGAVSSTVAGEMAERLALLEGSEVTVGITGIAGPTGGSEEKPVGLVYIACSVFGKTQIVKYQFIGNRSRVRESAVSAALVLIRQCILDYFE